ncbi:proteoglycan 4-like [Lagopus muta]|uniref:proteoglycan 4-like n=1 Tax=Lagopus muta TaxID=64668 RepID=UPI00209D04AB|nr:proteoglycan 4-like [Lagopus muta]
MKELNTRRSMPKESPELGPTDKKNTLNCSAVSGDGGGNVIFVKRTNHPETCCFAVGKANEKDLCSGKPADSMVALPNGTLAVFRGHYYWLLNGRTPPTTSPQRISVGWGIPSPIDAVFSRCNCDGKTFFIKGPLYWRFTNGVMDKGYPKPLTNGFAGLSGKIRAALPVASYNGRPESVYFIKRGKSHISDVHK